MVWILVLYIYAGGFAKGDSVTLMNAGDYPSKQACEAAGGAAAPLVKSTAKELRFACLPRPQK